MIGYHCDLEDCDTWTNDDYDEHFLVVTFAKDLMIRSNLHFCCMDHCGRYMLANSSPTETI